MSEQDRVDSTEHDDEVEAHKHHMTDDPEGTASGDADDFEAHGANPQGTSPQGAQPQASDDDDDFELHAANPQGTQPL